MRRLFQPFKIEVTYVLRKSAFMRKKWVKLSPIAYQTSFANLMSYGFTADMEQELDDIAAGKIEWQEVLRSIL